MKTFVFTISGLAILLPSFASACVSSWGINGGNGMMGYGGGMGVFMFAGGIIWTVVGVLAGVWLWQHINKK